MLDELYVAFQTSLVLHWEFTLALDLKTFLNLVRSFIVGMVFAYPIISSCLGCIWSASLVSLIVSQPIIAHRNDTEYMKQLRKAGKAFSKLIKEKKCGPKLLRLALHDAATYDVANKDKPWPQPGGANGSIRSNHELREACNVGLGAVLEEFITPVKEQVAPLVSWADLIQQAGALAVCECGGPEVEMKYGRVDVPDLKAIDTPVTFELPASETFNTEELPEGGEYEFEAENHLKKLFKRWEMDEKDIVAVAGGHTIGSKKEREWRVDKKGHHVFDNLYYNAIEKPTPETTIHAVDKVLMDFWGFSNFHFYFKKYQVTWFECYAEAHKRLSEQGCKFEPAEGIRLGEYWEPK